MLTELAARTLSGKTPPLAFRITLWILVVAFLGGAVVGVVGWFRMRRKAAALPEGDERGGRSTQAGCLMAGAIPLLLFGLFLLDWAIQVS
ncbi:hypothetical protein [Flexivirga caeni]|uniref:Uncharacterized protein n=1 Tax=Flexivirga caeni TaxID=2294115 RepID=A0A3M9MID0_9MICO|nr:hypothetical protein [Flexivirga caeni]RNI25266.1 hypothetical protein EFY87_01110 [Flexivirga caeni]